MPRSIAGKVVVITGASSGIGRAAALAFASRGANLVLGARRELLLSELASACQRLGGRALAAPLDVPDKGSAQQLADRASETFGRLDVWINNAGVGLFGRFREAPLELHKRVLETNLQGCMNGAWAALPGLIESHGVLINNASALAESGAPFASSYAAAAAGIRAFSSSLRQELRSQGVSVCTILPGAVDTPFFQHAANFTGHALRGPARAHPADEVAQAMVMCAEQPRAELFVGRREALANWLHAIAPSLEERLGAERIERGEFQSVAAAEERGNLDEPLQLGRSVSGGWRGYVPPGRLSSRGSSGRTRLAAVGLAIVAGLRGR